MDSLRSGINDHTNILGLAALVTDTDDIRSEVDLNDLESRIVNQNKKHDKPKMAPETYSNEIQKIVKEMPSIKEGVSSSTDDSSSDDSSDSEDSHPKKLINRVFNKPRASDEERDVSSAFKKSEWYNTKTQEEHAQNVIGRVFKTGKKSVYDEPERDHELERMIAKEQEEDLKAMSLAQFDLLRSALLEDHVDLSRVPAVDEKSSMAQITAALRMLRHKNDLRRFVNIGEDFMIMMAYGMEALFDGENDWFGMKPNLSGWSDTVKPRIRKMRADTSAVVSSAMNQFNFGPLARICMDLIPSAVLYGHINRSKKKGQASESEWKDSIRHIDDVVKK